MLLLRYCTLTKLETTVMYILYMTHMYVDSDDAFNVLHDTCCVVHTWYMKNVHMKLHIHTSYYRYIIHSYLYLFMILIHMAHLQNTIHLPLHFII